MAVRLGNANVRDLGELWHAKERTDVGKWFNEHGQLASVRTFGECTARRGCGATANDFGTSAIELFISAMWRRTSRFSCVQRRNRIAPRHKKAAGPGGSAETARRIPGLQRIDPRRLPAKTSVGRNLSTFIQNLRSWLSAHAGT